MLLSRCCVIAGLLAALPAFGQAPITYDVHLGAANAQGDFRSELGSRAGLDTGLSMTIPLSRRISLRPKVSHEIFQVLENNYTYQSSRYSDRGFENAKWSAWSYGAECVFRPYGEQGRLYLFSGLFYKSWRVESYGGYVTQDRLNGTKSFTVDDTSTSNEPAVTMGFGVSAFRHLSFETHMTLASYRKLSYNTLHLGLVVSF